MALIGDIKKDKLKNSIGMSNEEKEKLVARDKDQSRNRGICMVSLQNRNVLIMKYRVKSKYLGQEPISQIFRK